MLVTNIKRGVYVSHNSVIAELDKKYLMNSPVSGLVKSNLALAGYSSG